MLPTKILNKLNEFEINTKQIKASALNINDRYHNESGNNKSLISSELDAISYSLYRMPATYEVCNSIFKEIKKITKKENFNSALDAGSGTGSGTIAFLENFSCNEIDCLEREQSMINISKKLTEDYNKITIKKFDLINDYINEKYDIVFSSYVFNEFNDETKNKVIEKLWNATNDILIIIEPGTTTGFNTILKLREQIIKKGGNILAPCTHANICPLINSENEWCHFSCRIQRSKLLKQIKSASSPFEDEKFSYIAFSKNKYIIPNSRIIKHPFFKEKIVQLTLCNSNGINTQIITKSSKEQYKKARNSICGDCFE